MTEIPIEFEPPQSISGQQYVDAALENLRITSRTADGVIDTSASVGKAEKIQKGLTPEQTAEQATTNFVEAIKYLYEHKDQEFQNAAAIQSFIEGVAKKINEGLLKEGVLIRNEDSDTLPYTRIKDLELAMKQFYQELFDNLSNSNVHPKEIAALIEYRIDLTDHFFADGCGKTAKALSAWSLMRANQDLPHYNSRESYYEHAPKHIRGQDKDTDEQQWQTWLAYYKTLFTKDSHE